MSQKLVCNIKIEIILSCDIIVRFCVRVNLYLGILCFRFQPHLKGGICFFFLSMLMQGR